MDFLKPVFLVLALSALSTAAPQGQQCLSCTIDKAIREHMNARTPRGFDTAVRNAPILSCWEEAMNPTTINHTL